MLLIMELAKNVNQITNNVKLHVYNTDSLLTQFYKKMETTLNLVTNVQIKL
jgi:hypothetical protein